MVRVDRLGRNVREIIVLVVLPEYRKQFDLAAQEIASQILWRRPVERHSIVFRGQGRLAECIKFYLHSSAGSYISSVSTSISTTARNFTRCFIASVPGGNPIPIADLDFSLWSLVCQGCILSIADRPGFFRDAIVAAPLKRYRAIGEAHQGQQRAQGLVVRFAGERLALKLANGRQDRGHAAARPLPGMLEAGNLVEVPAGMTDQHVRGVVRVVREEVAGEQVDRRLASGAVGHLNPASMGPRR